MYKILVADDEIKIRNTIKDYLTAKGLGVQNAMDPDLIDCYIYESNAAWKKYRFLLKQVKML